jgi:hypothetical protein
MALGFKRHQRERGILRRQFGAVVESGLRAQREAIRQLVRRNLYGLCHQTVHRIGFVAGTCHQRRECHVHALRAFAFEDIGVEGIEGLIGLVVGTNRRDQRKCAAFRRGRIDVVEVLKIGRIFQVAEHRKPMSICAAIRRKCRPQPRRARNTGNDTGAKTEHMPAGEGRHARKIPQDLLPILAALSASNHHKDGRPERAYFGNSA